MTDTYPEVIAMPIITAPFPDHSRRAPAVPEVRHDEGDVQFLIDVDSPHVSSVPADFESQKVQTSTQADRERLESDARAVKEKATAKKAAVKKRAAADWRSLQDNSDNPIVVGNAITIAALGGLLGLGAYRKHVQGELTWKLAGLWAGAVGLFGVADYYVSS